MRAVVALASVLALACTGTKQPPPVARRIDVPSASIAVVPGPPPEPPERDWHTWTTTEPGDGPFHRVAEINMIAPSVGDGSPCEIDQAENATFLRCGGIARVDGARLDLSIASKSSRMGRIRGRYPDDLWSRLEEYQHGWTPPPNPFQDLGASWMHYTGGTWDVVKTTGERFPYVGKSSLLFVMPPSDRARPSSGCADYACLEIVPRVMTTGDVKPDFSALEGKVAWLHRYDETKYLDDDFVYGADPDGPVYVVMRAQDLRTKKKGFGVARWTPKDGATFELFATTEGTPKELTAKDGKASFIFVAGKERTLFELAPSGRWTKKGTAPERAPDTDATKTDRFVITDQGTLAERLPGGGTRPLVGFEDGRSSRGKLRTVAPNDTWFITDFTVYRTIPPPEVLYRTEAFGQLHPWAPFATDECRHLFAVFDATLESRAPYLRKSAWGFAGDLPLVEFTVHGHVVVGAVVKTREEGERLIEKSHLPESRLLEGPPQEVVCARPLGEHRFVSTADAPNE